MAEQATQKNWSAFLIQPGRIRYFGTLLVVAAAYLAAARVGLRMGFVPQVTAVWPPTGIALAATLRLGYRIWPALAVGAFLANVTANEPIATACAIALGNTLEALAGAWLLRRVGFTNGLSRLKDALSLAILGAGLSTTVSATVGVTSLCLGGVQKWADFGSLWGVWWLGDAVGGLVVAPPLLTLAFPRRAAWQPWRLAEGACLIAGLVAAAQATFTGQFAPVGRDYPLEYVVFPFVIWAALRFGPWLTSLATLLTVGIAVWGTLNDFGPFARGRDRESLLLLQAFMGVVALAGLVLAGAVAERRLAADRLRQSHSLLGAITEGTTDAVFVKDQRGLYLTINAAGARLLGKAVSEVLGRDDTELFSPETARTIMERDRRIMAGGEAEVAEEVGTAAGVTRTYLTMKAPYRDHEGRVAGVVGIAREITDRKRLEEELRRRAAELAEGDRRKDEFLAMLAHELRNPLAPIRNAVQVMRLPNPDPARLQWAQAVVERQVQQMARLVDDLLDLSRITRGKINLQNEPVELAAVVARAVETSRPLIDARDHQLTVVLPQQPVRLHVDPARLAQVLANLLNNAAKFTEPGGRIALSAAPDGNEIVVRVQDTGSGIPPDLLPRLFQPFTQADRSLDRSQGGLGIGLALVRRLVEMQGGTVTASSTGPARGSEFVVRLPVVGPTEAYTAASHSSAPPSGKPDLPPGPARRVLVVDDNVDSAESLAFLLQMEGHHVRVVHSGPQALDAAAEQRPEVVLLDLGLPEMDGYEVARRLRERPGSKDALLVALTGYGQDQDKRRSREAGFDHHLVKPVEPGTLKEVVAAGASPRS